MPVTVWIIDDDADVAVHLELVLRRAGFEADVEAFATGGAAQEAAQNGAAAPDLVLVDQLLPDVRGSELLLPLHEAYPMSIIRLITAAPDEIDEVDRAIGVVEKPPTPDVLKALFALRRP